MAEKALCCSSGPSEFTRVPVNAQRALILLGTIWYQVLCCLQLAFENPVTTHLNYILFWVRLLIKMETYKC